MQQVRASAAAGVRVHSARVCCAVGPGACPAVLPHPDAGLVGDNDGKVSDDEIVEIKVLRDCNLRSATQRPRIQLVSLHWLLFNPCYVQWSSL